MTHLSELPVEELIESPDYKKKVGFLGTFEEDFARIVEVATRRSPFWRPRKLVIFIDDLDRCSPAQAASIIEAVNLFLDSVGCVFVLGMDTAVVAASIEVKYRDLADKLRREAPDILSPGNLFLEKIVQIPFQVPRPSSSAINKMVGSIIEPTTRTLPPLASLARPDRAPGRRLVPDQPPQQRQASSATISAAVDRASFARDDIRRAIMLGCKFLKENPRQIKRFINIFRLQVYIASQRGMLSDEDDIGLRPEGLAIWVAWAMQWGEIVTALSNPIKTEPVCKNLAAICERLAFPTPDTDRMQWSDLDGSLIGYLDELTNRRKDANDMDWSSLPWHLWVRDNDFLECVKHLELYWQRPHLLKLNALLDMASLRPTGVANDYGPGHRRDYACRPVGNCAVWSSPRGTCDGQRRGYRRPLSGVKDSVPLHL